MAHIPASMNKTFFTYESGLYGVPSGTGQWVGQVQEVTGENSEGVIVSRYHGTTNRNVDQRIPGARDYGGGFSYYMQDFKMLQLALGAGSDSTTGSPAFYTHTISELEPNHPTHDTSGADNPFASFALETSQSWTAGQCLTEYYKGCVVDSLTITSESRMPLLAKVDFVAQTCDFSSGASTLTASEPSTRPYIWSDTRIHFPSGTTINVDKWEYSIANNIARDEAHIHNGSRVITTPQATEREHQLILTMKAESSQAARLYGMYRSGGNLVENAGIVINSIYGLSASGVNWICLSGCAVMDFKKPNPNEGLNEWVITLQPDAVSAIAQDQTLLYNCW